MFTIRRLGTVFGAVALCAIAGCSDPTEGKPDAIVTDVPQAANGIDDVKVPAGLDPFSQNPEGSRPKVEAKNAVTYNIAEATKIGFVASKVTRSHEGGFTAFEGEIMVPDENVERATIDVVIDVGSVFTDEPDLTKHLKSPDFFDVGQFLVAIFGSTAIVKTKSGYDVTGDLQLHGVTKRITFPATIVATPESLTADAEFVIKRFDFGIVYPGMADDLIRDDVLIKLHVVAKPADSAP